MSRARFGGKARSASSTALAAFAVHQLRYLFSPGTGEDWFARLGHGYLGHLPPLLLGFVVAASVAGLARGATDSPRRLGRPLDATIFALGVVAVFCCQELVERVLLAGHADGLKAVFSSGGWGALPLAVLFGLLAALVDRGIESVEDCLAAASEWRSPAPAAIPVPASAGALRRRLSPLALGIARRPPPALS